MPQPVKKKKHLFTSKKMSIKALMSDCLGAIALVSAVLTVYITFLDGGRASEQCGAAVFLALLMAISGEIIAILSRKERDIYYVFSYLGMILNGLVILFGAALLYWGLGL